MSKYPLLNIYRILAIIAAVLIIIVGVIASLRFASSSSYDGSFDLGVFIASVLPFLGAAFGLGVISELISLLFDVVDHLEHIRFTTDRQGVRESTPAPTTSSGTPPRAATTTPVYEPPIRVRAKTLTTIRTKPDMEASPSTQLSEGQSLPIYGRTSDSTWFSISRQGTLWLDAADVEIIEGYLSNLPIVEPA